MKRFSLAWRDEALDELVAKADHETLAAWAIECAERVMPYFETTHPNDRRPRNAIEALQAWIDTGVFRMADVRRASLDAHAAIRWFPALQRPAASDHPSPICWAGGSVSGRGDRGRPR